MPAEESGSQNIKVCVRVRPPSDKELEHGYRKCIQVDGKNNAIFLNGGEQPKVFTYDHVFDESTGQEEVFRLVGRSAAEACVEGYNATIFASGQTGSGKTFTMQGPSGDIGGEESAELRGLIPRTFDYIFFLIGREKQKHGGRIEYLCRCSFTEIYCEQIFDLLDAASVGLRLREDMKKGIYIEGVVEENANSPQDLLNVLNAGVRNRHVGSTNMNRESSRSHSVFTVTLESKETLSEGLVKHRSARLNLVDLAGSERQKATDAANKLLVEANNINKSLLTLSNVISALSSGKGEHVPYRNSKLTFLLKDSLGGNSKTCIIAAASPADRNFGETLQTLKFAQSAKMIKNHVTANIDSAGSVAALQAEIARLRLELSSSKIAGPTTQGSLHSSMIRGSTMGGDKRISELEQLLAQAIEHQTLAEARDARTTAKFQALTELVEKKERLVQSTKMILRMREAALERYEKKNAKAATPFEIEAALRQEIELLNDQLRHNPEVTRFAMENLELREELTQLEAYIEMTKYEDHRHELVKMRAFFDQIGSQVRQLIDDKKTLGEQLAKAQQTATASPNEPRTPHRAASSNNVGSPAVDRRAVSQLERLLVDSANELKHVKAATAQESQQLTERIMSLEAALAAAEKATEDAEKTAAESRQRAATDMDTLRAEIAKHMETARTQSTKADAADMSLLQVEEMERQLSAVRMERNNAMTRLESVDAEMRKLKKQMAQSERDQRRMSSVHLSTALLADKTTDLQSAQADASAANRALAEAREQLAQLQLRVAEAEQSQTQSGAQAQEMVAEAELKRAQAEDELQRLELLAAERGDALAAMQVELHETVERLDTATAEVEFATHQLAQARADVAQLTSQLEVAQQQLTVKSEGMERLQSQLVSQVKSADDESAALLQNALSEVETLQSSLSEAQHRLAKAQAEAEHSRAALAAVEKENAVALRERDNANAVIANLQQKLVHERQQHEDAMGSAQEQLAELADVRESLGRTTASLQEAADKVAQLESQLEEAEIQHAKEVVDYSSRIDTLQEELMASQQAFTALKEQSLARAQIHTAAMASAAQLVRAARGQYETFAQSIRQEVRTSLESALSSIATPLRAQARAADVALRQSNSDLAQARDEITRLRAQAEAAVAGHVRTEAASEQALKQERDAAEAVRAVINEQAAKLTGLREQLTASQNECSLLRDELATVTRHLEDARSSERSLTTRVRQLEATFAARTEEIDGLCEQLSAAQRAVAALDSECMGLRVERGDLTRRVASLESELDAQIKKAQFQQEVLAEDIAALEVNVSEAQMAKKALEDETESLKQQIARALCDREEWLEELKRFRAMEECTFQENMEAKDNITKLTEENKRLTTELSQSKGAVDELTEQNAKLIGHQNSKQKIQLHIKIKEENNLLRKENNELAEAVAKSDRTMQRLEAEVRRLKGTPNAEGIMVIDLAVEDQLRADIAAKESRIVELMHLIDSVCQQVVEVTGVSAGESSVSSGSEEADQQQRVMMLLRNLSTQMTSKDRALHSQEMRVRVLEREKALMGVKEMAPIVKGGIPPTSMTNKENVIVIQ